MTDGELKKMAKIKERLSKAYYEIGDIIEAFGKDEIKLPVSEEVKALVADRDKWKKAAETRQALIVTWGRILGYEGEDDVVVTKMDYVNSHTPKEDEWEARLDKLQHMVDVCCKKGIRKATGGVLGLVPITMDWLKNE